MSQTDYGKICESEADDKLHVCLYDIVTETTFDETICGKFTGNVYPDWHLICEPDFQEKLTGNEFCPACLSELKSICS